MDCRVRSTHTAMGMMALIVVLVLQHGCKMRPEAHGSGTSGLSRTSGSVARVVSDTQPRWILEETLRIGLPGGSSPDVFGRIAALEVDRAGHIYVFDGIDRELRIFDSSGRFVRKHGRRGSGPGEFEEVVGIAVSPSGSVVLVDPVNARYTVIRGHEVQMLRRQVTRYRLPWLGGFTTDGRLYDAAVLPGRGGEALIRIDPTGGVADTLLVIPALAKVPRRGTMSFPLPYAPTVLRAIDPHGFVWTGMTDEYRIVKQSLEGDTVTMIMRAHGARPLTRLELDSLSRYVRQLRSQVGLDVTGDMIPKTAPVLQWIAVADDGSLWVSRTTSAERRAVEVFDSNGRSLAEVDLPFSETGVVPIIRNGNLYAVREMGWGYPVIVRARVRKQ